MRRLLPFLLLTILLVPACGDDDGSPSRDFEVTIEVVDLDGDPVPGLELVLWNDSPFLQDSVAAKAMTTIAWTQPIPSRVRVGIEDIEGDPVRHLIDAECYAGKHQIAWDGCDDEGVHQLSGLYTVKLEAFDRETGTEVEATESVDIWMAIGWFEEDQILGTTSERGRIVLRDMRIFPHLYDRPSCEARDENGEPTGIIELDENVVFLLRNPVEGGAMRIRSQVRRTGERVVLVWNPERKTAAAGSGRIAPADKSIEPPGTIFEMIAYPNPFN